MNDPSFPPSLHYLLLYPSFPPHEGHITAAEFDCGLMSEFVQSVNARFRPAATAPRTYRAILFATISGECFVAVLGPRNHFHTNFGSNLRVEGHYQGRAFTFVAPHFYCRRESGFCDSDEWILLEPINDPAVLTYHHADEATSARCLQLNFTIENDASRRASPLVVEAAGRQATFAPAEMSRDLLCLLQSGGLSSAPTTVVSFPLLAGDSPQQAAQLAWNITRFCGIAARQLTPPVRLELMDGNRMPVRVEFYSPVRTTFRKGNRYLLVGLNFPKGGLADFFQQCFDQFVALERSPSWRQVFHLAWTYEDGTFLETRIGTVMAAVELLLRLSLEEAGITLGGKLMDSTDPPNLGQLISAARGQLRWTIPKHYTRLERYRHARNAAVHARNLPCTPREALDLLQKWGLFLYRQIFIRLGFTGDMWAASRGFSTVTKVDDFSEEANDFTPRDSN